MLAVDGHVLRAGRVDPLANGVLVLVGVRVVELATLDVDRLAGEEVVRAAIGGDSYDDLPPTWLFACGLGVG